MPKNTYTPNLGIQPDGGTLVVIPTPSGFKWWWHYHEGDLTLHLRQRGVSTDLNDAQTRLMARYLELMRKGDQIHKRVKQLNDSGKKVSFRVLRDLKDADQAIVKEQERHMREIVRAATKRSAAERERTHMGVESAYGKSKTKKAAPKRRGRGRDASGGFARGLGRNR